MGSYLKNGAIAALLALAVGFMAFGGDAYSYLCTAGGKAQDAVKGQIPVSFQIDRASDMLAKLQPEIYSNASAIAKEEVALNNLDVRISESEQALAHSKKGIMRLRDDLARHPSETFFVYCSKNYTRSQVETDLANRLSKYEQGEESLKYLQQVKLVRTQGLEQARTKLQKYLQDKQRLEVAIEQLRSRQQLVEIAKSTSDYHFDNSRLGQIKKTVDEVESRLAVEERMLNTAHLTNDVVIDDTTGQPVEDITKRVDRVLGLEPGEAVAQD